MSRACFVISPMGDDNSPVRERADYVLDTYIRPACKLAKYNAVRADRGIGRDIVKGTTTALQNAPMAIAYMGPIPEPVSASHDSKGCWNANVMIEVGYRLASRLPLIFMCDQNSKGGLPELPLVLSTQRVTLLARPDPRNPNWVDPNLQQVVNDLVRQMQIEAEENRTLESLHPVATITADDRQNTAPDHLYYTTASDAANDLFGVKFEGGQGARLVGRTMDQFLNDVARRMNPAQWRAFERNQKHARSKLALRATGRDQKQAVASVPIVFENHEIEEYNHRAFLPIIVQDYRDRDGGDWYNLHVLYLNVTTATEKAKGENGEEYYRCRLDPTSDAILEPLKAHKPIRIFLSYRSDNRTMVEAIYERLRNMEPYVETFIDRDMVGGEIYVETLGRNVQESELCFLFLDDKPMGPGQQVEVNAILARLQTREGRGYPIVPVLLRSSGPKPDIPTFLNAQQWVQFEDLDDRKLHEILSFWFCERCPADWGPKSPYRNLNLDPPREPERLSDVPLTLLTEAPPKSKPGWDY